MALALVRGKIAVERDRGGQIQLSRQGVQHAARNVGFLVEKGAEAAGSPQHHRKAQAVVRPAQPLNESEVRGVQMKIAREGVGGRRTREAAVARALLIAQNSDRHGSQNPTLLKDRIVASRIDAVGFAKLCA